MQSSFARGYRGGTVSFVIISYGILCSEICTISLFESVSQWNKSICLNCSHKKDNREKKMFRVDTIRYCRTSEQARRIYRL